ncbi:hypothetical protein HDU83_008592 [Entophlyctis luteolus]|nr:hypothetical protein HDU82_001628 [Entophlyctis luteolus]KAJ3357085.1 hypothetical protein HDU83_008592 [Entophlyctis luteolus]KAJ3392041.1 hypothetical protein HDU84_004969 [Entophlyctis sp. JEL0112]
MSDEEHYWECSQCQLENNESEAECASCGEAKPKGRMALFRVGLVLSVAAIPKTQLRQLKVTLREDGKEDDADTLSVVTNARNVETAGTRVVVALAGAEVNGTVVGRAVVGGRRSDAMLCDGASLGWRGGSVGVAVVLGAGFAVGSEAPEEKPQWSR